MGHFSNTIRRPLNEALPATHTVVPHAIYRNKKTQIYYLVIGFAKHSENLEDLVIYRAEADPDGRPYSEHADIIIWARPARMWDEKFEMATQRPCATCNRYGHLPWQHAGWDPSHEGHG